MTSRRGLLIVISGPSGVGKDTLIRRLLELDPNLRKTVSYTTRMPRPGEQPGVDYIFESPRELNDKILQGNVLLEHAQYGGHEYATPAAQVSDLRSKGYDTVLKIEVQGAEQVRRLVPDALLIFIAPPSTKELLKRIEERHSESAEDIAKRLKIAEREMEKRTEFDYVAVNDDLERAAREVLEIIRHAREGHT